jgi:hypothetical protein
MNAAGELPGLGLPARVQTNPVDLKGEFLRAQERHLLSSQNLRRLWRKAGKPPCNEVLRAELEADSIGSPSKPEDSEMQKLLEAIVREPLRHFTRGEIFSLIQSEGLFSFWLDGSLRLQSLRSHWGKYLRSNAMNVFQVDGKTYVFACRGSGRSRRYYVRPEVQ